MMNLRPIAFALLAISLLSGCGSCDDPLPASDVALLEDTGPDVHSSGDTGTLDTGTIDTGITDTGTLLDTGTTDTSTTDTGTTDSATTDTGTADTDTPDTGAPDTGIPDTGPTSVCGDSKIEGDEVCDDGNMANGDYCAADCRSVTGRCGDGKLQSNESCDDGTITKDCASAHDGGDGTCRPAGMCSPGYVFDSSSGTCTAKQQEKHVHIYVTNTCKLSVRPASVTVPNGQSVSFTYHNHSRSYAVDVWLSYGGGFLDLKQGKTWDDRFVHCNTPRPHTAYADITINGISLRDRHCPGHRMKIICK